MLGSQVIPGSQVILGPKLVRSQRDLPPRNQAAVSRQIRRNHFRHTTVITDNTINDDVANNIDIEFRLFQACEIDVDRLIRFNRVIVVGRCLPLP